MNFSASTFSTSTSMMAGTGCTSFLQWALVRLDMSWPGFRKVRGQVCKRVKRRMGEIGVANFDDYRAYLEAEPSEWSVLDGLCHITISRFYRDRRVFEALGRDVLPGLAETARTERRAVDCWSIGCASGEEVYSLRMVWDFEVGPMFPDVEFTVLGTDADPAMIARARRGCYSQGSLKDLPAVWRESAFEVSGGEFCVKARFRKGIDIHRQDIRGEFAQGRFDLIACRNIVFTYFSAELQRDVLERITGRLRPGGFLVIGAHEALPAGAAAFTRSDVCRQIWSRTSAGKAQGRS